MAAPGRSQDRNWIGGMMCGKNLKLAGSTLLLSLVLLLLSWLAWPLPLQSQEAEDLIYQACQEIVQAHPDMKPMIELIANGLRQIAERQTANSQALQTTIDGQALKITELQTTISDFPILLENSTISHIKVEDDLKRYANDLETGLAITGTVGGISIIFNIIQAIACQIK